MAKQRQMPPAQAPVVQKLRFQYAKRGRARFVSHRDFSRALERAVRRANVPIAYSSGFHPHPRLSFAGAAPTSAASEAEFFELLLAEVCEPQLVLEALSKALPEGLDLVAVSQDCSASFTDLLTHSDWVIELAGVDEQLLAASVESLLELAEFNVQRLTKSGMRTFDIRPAILQLEAAADKLNLRIEHHVPLVRPDDVLGALKLIQPQLGELNNALLTRISQGRLVDGEIVNPFA